MHNAYLVACKECDPTRNEQPPRLFFFYARATIKYQLRANVQLLAAGTKTTKKSFLYNTETGAAVAQVVEWTVLQSG